MQFSSSKHASLQLVANVYPSCSIMVSIAVYTIIMYKEVETVKKNSWLTRGEVKFSFQPHIKTHCVSRLSAWKRS